MKGRRRDGIEWRCAQAVYGMGIEREEGNRCRIGRRRRSVERFELRRTLCGDLNGWIEAQGYGVDLGWSVIAVRERGKTTIGTGP